MYAVIETGGKQYRVAEKDLIVVEKLDAKVGDTVQLTKVLMVADGDKMTFGAPAIAGASVTAKVEARPRTAKILVSKFRRRKGSYVRRGHRQELTRLAIEKISLS